ncbi:hypothetical protein QWY79_03595 [Halomonas sabkhae]|uniref:hypothetical protein n=1 Tax=Halomonas sabkhae TaxID=626223 RepID=UPI0025B4B212|nr:hypothetical protein [Halomonas sabkhae]MDN3524346.1 hypothetical protein [Halomonas sabkhae]
MPRRPAYKTLHYLRAVYNENQAPSEAFADLVRESLRRLPSVGDTKVGLSNLGVVGIRQRHPDCADPERPLLLAIGAGAPGERMGTFGTDVVADHDDDLPEDPPEDRAFKLADAFVLIEGQELLVCTDGAMRGYASAEKYLRGLFNRANLDPAVAAFELQPASNQEKRQTLEREGVKEIAIKGTMYAATQELEGQDPAGFTEYFRRFRQRCQDYLAEEVEDEQEQEVLARHWADINVTTTIMPKGGTYAVPAVLTSLDEAGLDMVDEIPDDSEVVITTRAGNTIRTGDVILKKKVRLRRKEQQNDLDAFEVWDELKIFHHELRHRGAWQR